MLVFDARGSLVVRDAAGACYLLDLADADDASAELPRPVAAAMSRARTAPVAAGDDDDDERPCVRGASGCWYSVHAAVAEPDASRGEHTIVVITPARAADPRDALLRLYGITHRQRDVLLRLAHGDSTKEIAAALRLSPYTVQEHVSNASAKVGVHGRRALLGRLFFDVVIAE